MHSSQAVGQAVLAALEKDRNLVLVASDSANAFGSILKVEIFAATKKRERAWLPSTQDLQAAQSYLQAAH